MTGPSRISIEEADAFAESVRTLGLSHALGQPTPAVEYDAKLLRHAVLGVEPSLNRTRDLERRGLGELRGHNPDWEWNRAALERMTLAQLEALYAEVRRPLLHTARLFIGGPAHGQVRAILYGDRVSVPDPDGGFAEYVEIEVLADGRYLGHVWIYASLTPELRKEAIERHVMAVSCKEPQGEHPPSAP